MPFCIILPKRKEHVQIPKQPKLNLCIVLPCAVPCYAAVPPMWHRHLSSPFFSVLPCNLVDDVDGWLLWNTEILRYGCFHSHGGTPKWFVSKGKSQSEMDDLGAPLENPHIWYIWYDTYWYMETNLTNIPEYEDIALIFPHWIKFCMVPYILQDDIDGWIFKAP